MRLQSPMSNSHNSGNSPDYRSGMIALVGRPNVGKSTLLNYLLGHKVSITSRRANTTRNRILGVLNDSNCQYVFIDLPGINASGKRRVDRAIHKTATASIAGVDLILFVVEYRGWQIGDSGIWHRIKAQNCPCVIAVSKIDRVAKKSMLLPVVERIAQETGITDIVPVSAVKRQNLQQLKWIVASKLPVGSALFPVEFVTDKNEVFHTSELIREQIFRTYGDEIPYVCAVQIERYEYIADTLEVDALIYVETESQKRIIIGSRGTKIKRIGTEVRAVLESELGLQVRLNVWTKVRSQWTRNERLIAQFGYSDLS